MQAQRICRAWGLWAVFRAGLWSALWSAAWSLTAVPASAQEPELKEIRFPSGGGDFPNPERGWYRYREMTASGSFNFAVRGENATLIFLKIRADAHRAGDLPAGLLARLQQAFDQARRDGVKLIPRVAYNDGPEAGCAAEYGCDAPKAVILRHIAQLGPLWKRNRDVIHVLDPGFIGGWGEWHTSSNGLDNKRDRTDILFAILDSLPADRMAYIRYPAFKREIFGGGLSSETQVLGPERAFDGSRLARVGHLNDCLFSSEDDVGTYQHTGWPRAREVAYVGGESRFAPFGGETCALHARGECAAVLQEMAALHIDHLNHDYHGGAISRWRTQGCHDTISLKLGHRLALEWARLPDAVKPGGVLRLRFAIRNLGFGELFNPRDVEAVLHREGRLESAALPVDPRRWAGGSADTVEVSLAVPAGLPVGAWRLGLRLADKDTALRKDPRYSIRFANPGVWSEADGINVLKADLQVSAAAPGAADPGRSRFEVIAGSTRVRADPDPVPLRGGEPGFRLRAAPGRLEVTVPAAVAGPFTVRLLSLAGSALPMQLVQPVPNGSRALVLETGDWPIGVYLLTLTAGATRAAWTVVVHASH